MSGKRIADYGVHVGSMERGRLNKITDVPGVLVGHATIRDERHHTGVTVILPCADNMFKSKLTAASYVLNGFGKTQGLVQVDELGTLETPIALTNTLNVGKVHGPALRAGQGGDALDQSGRGRMQRRVAQRYCGQAGDAGACDAGD